MRYISSILCAVAVLGLVGCSKNNQQTPQNMSACSGDPYLMKYGCSVSRVASAAQNGDADAQYALGYMYYYGVDTARDKDSAKLWISRAAAQGQPLAKSALAMIQGKAPVASQKVPNAVKKQMPVFAKNKKPNVVTATKTTRTVTKTPVKMAAKKPVPVNTVKHTAADRVTSVANSTAMHATESRDVLQMEAALMHEPTNGYTLQLMGNHNEKVIKNFMRSHRLEGKAVYYYSTFNHSKWYMLVYGQFNTVQDAHAAIAKLPPELRKLQPWIKPNRDVKAEIKTRHLVS
jgi:DamX protein